LQPSVAAAIKTGVRLKNILEKNTPWNKSFKKIQRQNILQK